MASFYGGSSAWSAKARIGATSAFYGATRGSGFYSAAELACFDCDDAATPPKAPSLPPSTTNSAAASCPGRPPPEAETAGWASAPLPADGLSSTAAARMGSTFGARAAEGPAEQEASGQPSFYGKGPKLRLQRQQQGSQRQQQREHQPQRRGGGQAVRGAFSAELGGQNADAGSAAAAGGQQTTPGGAMSVLPKRAPRAASCYDLDKEIAACASQDGVLAISAREAASMDGANWANLVYALAHCRKHGTGDQRALKFDSRWMRAMRETEAHLVSLTARDTANLLWSLATLDLRSEVLFMEAADTLCSSGKLSVCDPISVSKAAWALTAVKERDRRLAIYNHLAVPVVLGADAYPLGAITMTCYAFAKADHRDGDVYEALSSSLSNHPLEEMRPIDVCNVVWAFCTVGYRDDQLFDGLCVSHLSRETLVAEFNPQDLTNTTWGFSKVLYTNAVSMDVLANEGLRKTHEFKAIHFSNLLYSFAQLRLCGPEGFLRRVADAAVPRIGSFDPGNLAIAVWALAMQQVNHVFLDRALEIIQSPSFCEQFTTRSLSMLFLAYFRLGRFEDVDAVLAAALLRKDPIGASGFSAVIMAAEQGVDAVRELRVQQAMADEVADDKMQAAVCNAAAIRLMKRGRPEEARRLLNSMRGGQEHSRRWSAVSDLLLARLPPDSRAAAAAAGADGSGTAAAAATFVESWQAPVKSGMHPMAATRQNEGPHAYTREFMTLQAVLCTAPAGDVDACMAAVEQFAESRSMWLKITAWEKATVVHEVARLSVPGVVVEIGAYIGYSAMNLGRAVREHGGRVASIEVDPIHATIVRNMVEYAGLTDTVDVWTGFCYDVFPHLLREYGPASIGMVFMDQKGTRFHTDLERLRELGLLADGAVVLADNVLKPGAPLYIWHLMHGPYTHCVTVSVREFLLQSEDWMVMAFHDAAGPPVADPPLHLHRLAFDSDAFRRRSMFDGVAPSKADWWKFSQSFVEGLARVNCRPRQVGLHGRENPVLTPADIEGIFRAAGRAVPP